MAKRKNSGSFFDWLAKDIIRGIATELSKDKKGKPDPYKAAGIAYGAGAMNNIDDQLWMAAHLGSQGAFDTSNVGKPTYHSAGTNSFEKELKYISSRHTYIPTTYQPFNLEWIQYPYKNNPIIDFDCLLNDVKIDLNVAFSLAYYAPESLERRTALIQQLLYEFRFAAPVGKALHNELLYIINNHSTQDLKERYIKQLCYFIDA